MMASSQPPAGRGRGRGRGRGAAPISNRQWRPEIVFGDPSWDLNDLTAEQFNTAERPSLPAESGRVGGSIDLLVNYYPVQQFPKEGLIHKYHFDVTHQTRMSISRERRRALYESWLRTYCRQHSEVQRDRIVFDNEAIVFVLGKPLPGINESGIEEAIQGPGRAMRFTEYQITIKRVGSPIDLRCLRALEHNDQQVRTDELQSAMQALSILMHEKCSSKASFIYRRTFFSQPTGQGEHGNWDLGEGKALWRGFYSCLLFRNGAHQLLMNIDVSYGVFLRKQPFLDFLRQIIPKDSRNSKATLSDVKTYLNGNLPSCTYAKRVAFLLGHCRHRLVRSHVADKTIGYTIVGFGDPASRQTFPKKEKGKEARMITVADYFKEQYQIILEHPELPTVHMRNDSFVPMEFLEIEPVRTKRITDEQRALLCLKSSLEPPDYLRSVAAIRNNPEQQRFEDDPFVQASRLTVGQKMLRTTGRVIPAPTAERGRWQQQRSASSRSGNNTGSSFYKPAHFPSVWAMINLSSSMNCSACEEFYVQLRDVANSRGIDCPEPEIYEEYDAESPSITEIINALRAMMRANPDCKFFIVILPDSNELRDRVYGELKKLCELKHGLGVVTQMVRATSKTGGRNYWNYSKLSNLFLKINTKLNGVNSVLRVAPQIEQFFARGHRIMYVGIDLSHGAPGLNQGRSTVAVVASADDIPNRYFKEVYLQERPAGARGESWEYVIDLKAIMMSLIRQYYEKHENRPPKSIVIYRDGISEGEFDTVFENELTAVREACTELSSNYRPRLTYIVVNKRGPTRFVTADSEGNVPAGTVVDSRDVVPTTTYNFFLTSHRALKGTARSTHYHVLYDDNELRPDQVQLLTNALCHASARCTSAISIPAPVKYADLLAFRANFYTNINEPREASAEPALEDIRKQIKSTPIALSSDLDKDCPFFV